MILKYIFIIINEINKLYKNLGKKRRIKKIYFEEDITQIKIIPNNDVSCKNINKLPPYTNVPVTKKLIYASHEKSDKYNIHINKNPYLLECNHINTIITQCIEPPKIKISESSDDFDFFVYFE